MSCRHPQKTPIAISTHGSVELIMQHIPEKPFNIFRYYRCYSNKSWEMFIKRGMVRLKNSVVKKSLDIPSLFYLFPL